VLAVYEVTGWDETGQSATVKARTDWPTAIEDW
jgi:hypothetical protein